MSADTETEALLRRYNTNIRLSGKYYIYFGIWSVMRLIAMVTMNSGLMDELRRTSIASENVTMVNIWNSFFYGTIAVLCIGVMLFHIYLGRAAIRYSTGESTKKTFLVFAVIVVIGNVLSFPINLFSQMLTWDDLIATTLVDLTVSFLLLDMVYSAWRVSHLKKMRGEGAAERVTGKEVTAGIVTGENVTPEDQKRRQS